MDKFQWVLDNWELIGLILSVIALAITGKWGLVRARVAELLVQSGEGPINRTFRKMAKNAAEKESPIVRDTLKNMAAKSDPDPEKKPESRGKRAMKFLGRSALKLIFKR